MKQKYKNALILLVLGFMFYMMLTSCVDHQHYRVKSVNGESRMIDWDAGLKKGDTIYLPYYQPKIDTMVVQEGSSKYKVLF